jgi:hypothetical protein
MKMGKMSAQQREHLQAAILGKLYGLLYLDLEYSYEFAELTGRPLSWSPSTLRPSQLFGYLEQERLLGCYFSDGQVRRVLKKLEAEGVVVDTSRVGQTDLKVGWSRYRLVTKRG